MSCARRRGFLAVNILWLAAAATATGAQMGPPRLLVEAPPSLSRQAEEIRRYDVSRLSSTMRLVGLEEAGPPIRVVLVEGASDPARTAPDWANGYAQSARDLVVLIPSRSFTYPHGSLETVLQHEIAHILIHRAAGGHPVPRWFNEGVAMAAARAWDVEDRTRLIIELLPGDRLPFRDVDALFDQGRGPASRAYALSGAFVRDLLENYGPQFPARVLARLASGASFEEAFQSATGASLAKAESEFYRRQNILSRWIPFLTSALTLWTGITVLALVAVRKRRLKDARMKAQWEAEEDIAPETGLPPDPSSNSPSDPHTSEELM